MLFRSVMVDPPQSVEIDRLDEEVLAAAAAAAAAMSIVRLDEEALALEAALERLVAMASVRSVLCAGKKCTERGRRFGGEGASEDFWTLPLAIYKGVKSLESYSVVPQ